MRLIFLPRLRYSLPVAIFAAALSVLASVQPVVALTVSPVRLEITVDPGKTYQGQTVLKNEQKDARTFYSSFENFEARGDTGTPYFVPGKDGLAGWISGAPESITLQSGERKIVPFTITVPSDAKPGGYFSAILWNDTPPEPSAGGQVAIGAKVGSLVLLRVSGDVEEAGGIASFALGDDRAVRDSLPVSFIWRFQNAGGDRVKPEGTVKITNTLGMTSAEIPANPTKGNILPGSTRKFDVTWAEEETGSGSTLGMGFFSAARQQARHWRMGRYVASLALSYGEAGNTGGADIVFYVLPWQLLTVLFVGLLLLVLVIKGTLAGYKRRILAQVRTADRAPTTPKSRGSRPASKAPARKKGTA